MLYITEWRKRPPSPRSKINYLFAYRTVISKNQFKENPILENKFHKVMIDDIEQETEPWLIDGMVCPWLTLLSGQPKHGKTILAGHIATALINNQPLQD